MEGYQGMKYGEENGDYNWGSHRGYPKTLNTKPLKHLTIRVPK